MRIQKAYTLFFAFLFSFSAFGQSTLEDAIFLRQFITEGEENASTAGYFTEDTDAMRQYVPALKRVLGLEEDIDEDLLAQVISDRLFENPFINSEDEDGTKILLPASYSSLKVAQDKLPNAPYYPDPIQSQSGQYIPDMPRPAGGFTTRFVDGLSRWLVKRTKQELSLTFFNRFKKALNEQPDLNVMFPSTVTLLNVFEDEVYHYQAFIGTLRESFINDFNLIPQNLSDWADNTELIQDETERFVIKEAFEIPPMIINENSPREIIHHLGSVKNCPEEFKNVFSSFQVVDLLSESIFSSEWDFPTDYESKIDDLTLYLYLGILYEKSKNIRFQGKTFNSILADVAHDDGNEKTDQMKNLVFDFLKHGKETNRFFNLLSSQDSIEYTMYHQYTKSTLSLLGVGKNFHEQYLGGQSKQFTDLLSVIGNSNDLVFHIHQKNFLQSVAHINQIVGTFIPSLEPSEIKALTPLEKSIYTRRQKGKERFIKYSTFMGTVADAQSSEQVEFAFELFALPPGSSKMKKQSPISVALNAYVGPSGGVEFLENFDENAVFALHAPVGINLNWGLQGDKGSFSLFVPIIDVGAVTAFRFGDDTSTLPELSFKNIIAPGLYAVYGFGNDLPFAFGVGGQLGPNTRKIEVDEFGMPTENRIDSGFRIGAFLSVDIPVFHFYTK